MTDTPPLLLWLERHASGSDGRIPAERTLAAQLGLSRAELRKGLADLEAEGRLVRQVGRGTFLRPWSASSDAPTPPPGQAPSPTSLAAGLSPRHVMQARVVLEPEIARSAALHATRRRLDALRDAEAVVAMATTWETFDRADDAFHREIAGAAGNDLLLALGDTVAAVRREIAWGRLLERGPAPPKDHGAFAEHRAIADAIAARDGEAAAEALRRHLMREASALLGPSP